MNIVVSRIFLSHPAANEIVSVRNCIQDGRDFRTLLGFQEKYDGPFEANLKLSSEQMDPSVSSKLLIELVTLDHWPFDVIRHLERKGFQVVAHMHEDGGDSARFYSNGEIFEAPSWVTDLRLPNLSLAA